MVQIMIASGTNDNGLVSMPIAMAQFMETVFRGAWPLIDSFVGALGAFMSGSNTVSNMLFSLFQYTIADNLGISHIIIVSLQNVGGSFGNMINIQKIITACAVVGLIGVEGLIIKRTIIPMTVAILITGIVGLILVFFVVPGLF
jgi:lactate permease